MLPRPLCAQNLGLRPYNSKFITGFVSLVYFSSLLPLFCFLIYFHCERIFLLVFHYKALGVWSPPLSLSVACGPEFGSKPVISLRVGTRCGTKLILGNHHAHHINFSASLVRFYVCAFIQPVRLLEGVGTGHLHTANSSKFI